MLFPIAKEKVFKGVGGKPVLNGAGGVVKMKEIDGRLVKLLRFISIFCPINDYLNKIPGDDDKLPYVSQVSLCFLFEDEIILIDREDFESCFNLFSLPEEWRGFFTYEKEVDASAFGGTKGETTLVALASVPMGWISAVALIQAGVRHIVFEKSGVDLTTEVRKDKSLPAGDDKTILYLDNFDQLRTIKTIMIELLKGDKSPEQKKFVEVCEQLNLPLNVAKRLVGAVLGSLQGGELEGDAGIFGLSHDKKINTIEFGLCLMTEPEWHEKPLRHWGGKSSFASSFRRPLFSILQEVFTFMGELAESPQVPPADVMDEVVVMTILIPMAFVNLRASLDNEIVVTDASPTGGGVATATNFKSKHSLKDGNERDLPRLLPERGQRGRACLPLPSVVWRLLVLRRMRYYAHRHS